MSAAKNKGNETESVRLPEILCQILQFAVGPGGVRALLPFTHVCAHWRRSALGDSSLWTTIHLKQTTAPLLDLILARAGTQLFTVYVDHPDFNRLAKLWERFDRVEELHYTYDGIEEMTPFIDSLGPAPNLKALYLQPGLATGPIPVVTKLQIIFSGCLPLLRTVAFSNTIAWPAGLFKNLASFDCGASEKHPISAENALDAIRESPSIKFIRLAGYSAVPEGVDPPVVDFPSLEKCTLVGDGTTSLIRFIIAPVTALVSLSKSHTSKKEVGFPKFNDCSVAPGIRLLGEVSSVSLSISDNVARLQARNNHGGVLDARVDGLYGLSRDTAKFAETMWSYFRCWHACPGFEATKKVTLSIERARIWPRGEGIAFSFDLAGFLLNLPNVEEVTLRGVPPRELSGILLFLPSSPESKIKRLDVESTPLRSPRSLLPVLDKFLAERKGARVPLQSVAVKVKCEEFIPVTEHSAFLAAWEGFVEGGVRLEYERVRVKRFPGCRQYDCGCGSEEDKGGKGVVVVKIGDPRDSCFGWGGSPEKLSETVEPTQSDETETARPQEFLCQILRFAVGSGGVKTLLPFTHVSSRWRRAAHGDSFLWTTIHLKQTTAPLLDMILAHVGNQLFTVYVDHHDFCRLAKLWELFDRVEELHYIHDEIKGLIPFITSLGPAPNLKALYLEPGLPTEQMPPFTDVPVLFSGCLPSLRSIALPAGMSWPGGLFGGLVSFEYGASEEHPISALHALDVLQYSPRIECLRLAGFCSLPDGVGDPCPKAYPSLTKCTMAGDGTTSLIQFLILPATALVSLSKLGIDDKDGPFPKFNDGTVVPALRSFGKVSAVSLSISDHSIGIQARNDHGGVLDARMDGLYERPGDPFAFTGFIRTSFESWRAHRGFDATKQFTLCVERERIWEPEKATHFTLSAMKFFFTLPRVEVVNLLGIPPRELSTILEFLCSLPRVKDRCPNLKRLQIESTPLRSPRSLLAELGRRFADRKETGLPLKSVAVKVKCETLIPATEHCALLASWESFVGEGARLEYERVEVEELPRCGSSGCEDENKVGGDEGTVVGDPGDDCVGWDGWPEKWPKTMGKMRGQ